MTRLWIESGGSGETMLVFLHGAGATAEVWRPTVARLDSARNSWITLDLPGHGRSERLPNYPLGQVAAAVARALPVDQPLTLVGHSLGGAVALTLASGLFGLNVERVLCLGTRTSWSPEELADRQRRATRPPRWFATKREAVDLFLRIAGFADRVPPPDVDVDSGVIAGPEGYALAHDPATGLTPPVDEHLLRALIGLTRATVVVGRGENDPTVTSEHLAALEAGPPVVISDSGHNVHLDRPDAVAELCAGRTEPGKQTHAYR